MAHAQFDRQASAVILNAILRGPNESRTAIRVLLDTGASYMLIPWKIARVLGYEPEISRDRLEIITASGVELAPLIKLHSVKVLGEEASGVEALVHDLPHRSYVHGLLGLSFLRNFKLTLDMRKGFFELIQE